MKTNRLRVLFLCTGNSCRSQMAEYWCRHLHPDSIEAYSAGTDPHGVNENAVRVMAEAGVSMQGARSNHVDEFVDKKLDLVVTVCDHANENCPIFPRGVKTIHVGFEDPPRLARGARTEEEALDHYRRVRDEIRAFVASLPDSVRPPREPS
ncbi:MAG: arsenate reductase ArsC [Gemmatimonadetes bacterium]|nr:arsenate reductase ArsC [Gemmatimonadota bacterium]